MRNWQAPSVLLAFATWISGCAAHHSHGAHSALNAPVEGITVIGQGKALGKPDIARANVGIEVRAATAEQATQELNTRMAALIAAIKQAGVAEKDVRTSNFSIHFEQVPEQPPRYEPAPAPTRAAPGKPPDAEPSVKLPAGHYRASNMVEVTIRDLDRAAQVLTVATRSGANQVFGIQFELDDPSRLQAEATAKAMVDAHQRAGKLAQQAGLKLGRVLSISEMGGAMPMQKAYGMRAEAADMSSVSVERGELTVHSNVQVVYALPTGD
jgi:uncharacterized protein YggE